MDKRELVKRFNAALSIANKASLYLLSHAEKRTEVKQKAVNDFVTAADREVEEIIESEIRKLFPDDGFYAEEEGIEGNQKTRWIIDPIDGTVDFMCSFPNYTVSIAFEDEDGLALGVVSIPRQHEVYYALRGEGAFLNGEKINTYEGDDFSKTLCILVPPHREHSLMAEYISKMPSFYDIFSDARSVGSAACSVSYVATGRCTAYYEMALHLYDVAAGIVILREAGGEVTLIDRGKSIDVIASSKKIHKKVLDLVK